MADEPVHGLKAAADDDDFEFDRNIGGAAPGGPKPAAGGGKPSVVVPGGNAAAGGLSNSLRVNDQHHDEEVDAGHEDSASLVSPEHSPSGGPAGGAGGAGRKGAVMAGSSGKGASAAAAAPSMPRQQSGGGGGGAGGASKQQSLGAAAPAVNGQKKPGDVTDDEDDDHHHAQAQAQAQQAQQAAQLQAQSQSHAHEQMDNKSAAPAPAAGMGAAAAAGAGGAPVNALAGQGTGQVKNKVPLYNPEEYRGLAGVTQEMQDLFDHIGRYKPKETELDTKMKPFIPDYIPAVGEIDNFIKIPPPAILPGTPAAAAAAAAQAAGGPANAPPKDLLGMSQLDEPASIQSDPTVLELLLRNLSRKTDLKPMTVRSIEHADKNPKKITSWITNVQEVHRKKPPPTVHYSKNMPDIEKLMQIWPQEFEDLLKTTPLPGAELGLDVRDYAKIVCSILDIPVYDKTTESLHLLFSLFSEFKSNAAFAQAGAAPGGVAAAYPSIAANVGAGGMNSLLINPGNDEKVDARGGSAGGAKPKPK